MSDFGKYTSRPVTIEAFKWEGHRTADEPQWFMDAVTGAKQDDVPLVEVLPSGGCDISTVEGTMRANVGDWIIQGTEGELYPCKDSVFQRKYAPAIGFGQRTAPTSCPGHAASDSDPKVCRYCGTHISEYQ